MTPEQKAFEEWMRAYPGLPLRSEVWNAALAYARRWLPIETAPQDGRRILAWFPLAYCIAVVAWKRNDYEDNTNWTLDGGESACLAFDPPTHWQPLPPTEGLE